MAVQIRKAKRSQSLLRVLLSGPSGCGKTFGGLYIGKGLGAKRMIVIDTEQGSSDLYDSILPFEVIDLQPPFTPERYIECIDAAEAAGADVIMIDSISHEWNGKGGCLELVDEVARAKFKGNTWSAWSELTPRHRAFIDRMLRSSAHIIATGRSKTETAQVDENGRKKVVKLGMRIESRDGVEFEFTTCLDIVHDGHFAVASKDRTGLFSGDPKPITEDTGRRLAEWLASAGAPSPVPAAPQGARAAPAAQATAASAFDLARKSIAESCSLDGLDVLRQRVDLRLGQGVFAPDEHIELVAAIHARAEELTDPDAGLGFPSESPETEAHA